MKRLTLILSLSVMMLFSACGYSGVDTISATPTPTRSESTAAAGNNAEGTTVPDEPEQSPAATPSVSASRLYDPSIFVIEASGSWQDELEAGYYANYECELYLDKIDSNDNRDVEGSYQGAFWMKTTLDTEEYIKEMFGDIPVDINFDAGGEAVCDNLGVTISTEDDKAWVNYTINGEDGQPLPLTQDTPVAKGSFVMIAKQLYLEAHASGVQGEKVDYSSNAGEGDLIDVNYIIHVQPDSMENGIERKVTINFSGEGFNKTIEGMMRRLPGYPEDVQKYLDSEEYQNSARRYLE